MQKPPSHSYPESASRGTVTSSRAFVKTIEHNRFVSSAMHVVTSATSGYAMDHPALAKHSPAVRYSRADSRSRDRWTSGVTDDRTVDTLFIRLLWSILPPGSKSTSSWRGKERWVSYSILFSGKRGWFWRRSDLKREAPKGNHGQTRLLSMRSPCGRSNIL